MALLALPTPVPLTGFFPELRTDATFLDVAFEMPDEWVMAGGVNRAFGGGLEFVPWGTRSLQTVKLECSADETEITPHGLESIDMQLPFRLADAIYCSSLSVTGDQLAELAVERVRLLESAAFASQLIRATTQNSDGLANTATVISGTAFAVKRAVARVEDFLATRLSNGIGFVHMPPSVFSLAVAEGSVINRNGMWTTATGHRVIADAGYVDAIHPTGQAQSQAESKWVYASGPVFYRKTTAGKMEGSDDAGAAYNFPHNDVEAYADVMGLIAFDPTTVGAVRVDLTA